MANQHHVVKNGKQWGIKKSGGVKSIQNFSTQQEAIDKARAISKNQESELVIHGRNGKIRAKDSHGKDKCPPRG